jgi:flagellar M-ring protein FliF
MPGFDGASVRRAGLVVAVVLAIGYAIQQYPVSVPSAVSPTTGTTQATPDALAAPAQSALDQILGPDHAVVTASATYSQASSRTSTTYDPKHVAPLSQANSSSTGYTASVTNNAVSRAVTRSSVPAGQIRRLTVAVVVDASLRPLPKLTAIRQSVTAAMGLQTSRGDRLSVVALPMPAVTGTTQPKPAVSQLTPYLPTGLGAAVTLVLLVMIALDARARRRRTGRAPSANSPPGHYAS